MTRSGLKTLFATILLLGLILTPCVAQNLASYHNLILDVGTGEGILATITVYDANTTDKATLYHANGAALANPVTTDSKGRFSFFITPGSYDIQVSGYRITTYTLEDVLILGLEESTYCDTYATFAAAITAIGAAETTLIITSQEAVTADVTVLATLALSFERGGSLNISAGKTVTINGPLDAGLFQIFEGAGKVVFGELESQRGLISEVYLQWWDNDLQKAIDAIRVVIDHSLTGDSARRTCQAKIVVTQQVDITDTIDMADLTSLEISGLSGVSFLIKTSNSIAFDLTNSRGLRFTDITFRMVDSYTPDCVLFLARDNSGASVGNLTVSNVSFYDSYGNIGNAFIYNFGSEDNNFVNCYVSSKTRFMTCTYNNLNNMSSSLKTVPSFASMIRNSFIGTYFYTRDTTVESFLFETGGGYSFEQCFFSPPAARYPFRFTTKTGTASRTLDGLWVNKTRFECRVITADSPDGANQALENVSFEDIDIGGNDDEPVIDLDKSTGAYTTTAGNWRLRNLGGYNIGAHDYEIHFDVLRDPDFYLVKYNKSIQLTVTDNLSGGIIHVLSNSDLSLAGTTIVRHPFIIGHISGPLASGTLFSYLEGSVVWDPGNLVDGTGEISPDITVTGAALGDYVQVYPPRNLQGMICTGYISAANTAKIRLQNETGVAINLDSATWKVKVHRY